MKIVTGTGKCNWDQGLGEWWLINNYSDQNYMIEPVDNIEMDLPGVGKDNINIFEADGYITVEWKNKCGTIEKRQFSVCRYSSIDASYIDGVLKIKLIPVPTKQIEIKSE